MASKAVHDAVKARQQASWTTVPVYYPNEAFEPPYDSSGNPLSFVQVEFPIGQGNVLTIDNYTLEVGTFRFVVSVLIGGGIETALTYADELAALFRTVRFDASSGYVQTFAPGPATTLGDTGAYYQVSFSVPYRYWIPTS